MIIALSIVIVAGGFLLTAGICAVAAWRPRPLPDRPPLSWRYDDQGDWT